VLPPVDDFVAVLLVSTLLLSLLSVLERTRSFLSDFLLPDLVEVEEVTDSLRLRILSWAEYLSLATSLLEEGALFELGNS
jgi:hypothetical protein